jgi:DNA-binding transcriptional MocR family regulator
VPEVVGRTSWQGAADLVRDLIRSGELATGDRLPPERDFARQLGIARPTLREALKALQAETVVKERTSTACWEWLFQPTDKRFATWALLSGLTYQQAMPRSAADRSPSLTAT